jgi:REP element-mobilizing transposase RayT
VDGVGAFKSFSARRINALRCTPGVPVWQRNYYEHIVRKQEELAHIVAYIQANPANWITDMNNMNQQLI